MFIMAKGREVVAKGREVASVQPRRLPTMGSTIQSEIPHVSHAVDNRSRDNGSSCFSPRAYLLGRRLNGGRVVYHFAGGTPAEP